MSTVTTATDPTTAATATTSVKGDNATLGKDDFLKLLVAQLQHQDPMNPTDNNEFMNQMTPYSTLEQVTNLAKTNEAMAQTLTMGQSLGLLGKTVTYVGDDGKTAHTGVVEKVVTEGGVAKLTIDGVGDIDPASVSEVSTPNQEQLLP